MFKIIGLFWGLLFGVTAWSGTTPHQPKVSHMMTQQRITAPFNQIWITGALNVVLHTDAKKSGIVLRGDAEDLAHLITRINQNQLTIAYARGYPKHHVAAHIYTPHLHVFHYKGAGVISGNIRSSDLALWIDNPGTTKLQGKITLNDLSVHGTSLVEVKGIKTDRILVNIQDKPRVYLDGFIRLGHLQMGDSGFLSMYWVKSERLDLHLDDHAQLQLAGFVNVLELKASGRSHFLGRYLRARRAFVKTYDHALAEINVIHREHTLATGASDIHIYHLPEMREDFMAYNGAVLDMRQWNLPEYQHETVYNKL